MLKIKNVSKTYANGFCALKNINLTINKGEFIGLLGVNGAGKTSLLSSIMSINNFEGEIIINGYNLKTHPSLAKLSIGFVPQEIAIEPFFSVKELLHIQSGVYKVKNNQAWIDEVVEKLHLKDKLNSTARMLSGGMKRRLMVALALVHLPPIIILDEPTAGVDVEIRESLWEFIRTLHQRGHTIILTSHYLEEIESLSDRIILIDKGEILADAPTKQFIQRFQNYDMFIFSAANLPCEFITKYNIEFENNRYQMKIESQLHLTNFLQELNQAAVSIQDFIIEKPQLQDVFLKLIRDKRI